MGKPQCANRCQRMTCRNPFSASCGSQGPRALRQVIRPWKLPLPTKPSHWPGLYSSYLKYLDFQIEGFFKNFILKDLCVQVFCLNLLRCTTCMSRTLRSLRASLPTGPSHWLNSGTVYPNKFNTFKAVSHYSDRVQHSTWIVLRSPNGRRYLTENCREDIKYRTVT